MLKEARQLAEQMNRFCGNNILGIYFVYALLILCYIRARKVRVSPKLARGLRVRALGPGLFGGLGGGETPPYWDLLKRKGPTG